MLFSEAANKFLVYMASIDRSPRTMDVYGRDLGYIRKYLEERKNGPVYLEDVTQEALEDFMRYAKEVKQYSPNTRSNYFYTLRALYAFAYKKGLAEKNIAASMDFMRMPKRERIYLTAKEVEAVVDGIESPLIKLMAIFLFNTGLRISECLNLTLGDVDLEKRTIHVRQGKGRKDRLVPINNKLYELLLDYRENWRDAYGSEFFFATRKTGSISYSYVNATIRNAAKKAGLKKPVSCHILRHSFASALVKKNVNLVQIQKLLGHESLAVTSIYTHTNMEALSDAVNIL
ncbi:MAG: tyrosine-type recombinase/integrase [Clostridiales bacterium]|jgi:site-specific recombinase XerD|nr:tyrosine-type recombinase/integrase [Clostridiales bacterium]